MAGEVFIPYEVFDQAMDAAVGVKQRARRAAAALEAAGVAYAIIGGNAVAAWISMREPAAARHTVDVDILLNRSDLPQAIAALEAAGFVYRRTAGVDFFLDGENSKFRDALHVVFAGEKVRPEYMLPAPALLRPEQAAESYRVPSLGDLVQMKLTSWRLKDRVHLQDLLSVGLLDESWVAKVPPVLAARMQEVLDNPEG